MFLVPLCHGVFGPLHDERLNDNARIRPFRRTLAERRLDGLVLRLEGLALRLRVVLRLGW